MSRATRTEQFHLRILREDLCACIAPRGRFSTRSWVNSKVLPH